MKRDYTVNRTIRDFLFAQGKRTKERRASPFLHPVHHFVPFLRLTSAAPAAVLDALPVLPLLRTLLAEEADFADVRITFFAMCLTSFPTLAEVEGGTGQNRGFRTRLFNHKTQNITSRNKENATICC